MLSRQSTTARVPLIISFSSYLPLETYSKAMVKAAIVVVSPGMISLFFVSQRRPASLFLMVDWDSRISSALDCCMIGSRAHVDYLVDISD